MNKLKDAALFPRKFTVQHVNMPGGADISFIQKVNHAGIPLHVVAELSAHAASAGPNSPLPKSSQNATRVNFKLTTQIDSKRKQLFSHSCYIDHDFTSHMFEDDRWGYLIHALKDRATSMEGHTNYQHSKLERMLLMGDRGQVDMSKLSGEQIYWMAMDELLRQTKRIKSRGLEERDAMHQAWLEHADYLADMIRGWKASIEGMKAGEWELPMGTLNEVFGMNSLDIIAVRGHRDYIELSRYLNWMFNSMREG